MKKKTATKNSKKFNSQNSIDPAPPVDKIRTTVTIVIIIRLIIF